MARPEGSEANTVSRPSPPSAQSELRFKTAGLLRMAADTRFGADAREEGALLGSGPLPGRPAQPVTTSSTLTVSKSQRNVVMTDDRITLDMEKLPQQVIDQAAASLYEAELTRQGIPP